MNLCSARHVTCYIWRFWEGNFSNIRLLPQNIMNWSGHKLSRRNSKIKLPPNIMTKLTLCFDINLLLILPLHVYTLPSLHFSKKTPWKKKFPLTSNRGLVWHEERFNICVAKPIFSLLLCTEYFTFSICVYLMKLSIVDVIWLWNVGWLENDELEWVWKEAAVT